MCDWVAPTVEKGRVDNASANGKSQPQLSNRLKQFSHDSNLLTMGGEK